MNRIQIVSENNKKLVSTLKRKMFRGYHSVIAKNFRNKHKPYSSRKQYSNTYTKFLNCNPQQESLPFDDDYQKFYKNKYLTKLECPNLNNLEIINYNKLNSNKNKISRNNKKIFLTSNKCSNTDNNFYLHPKIKEQNNLLKCLFPNENELKNISDLPFVPLNKNQNIFHYNNKSNKKDVFQEAFLYILSHKNDEQENFINLNFNKNKGLKRGVTVEHLNSKNNNKKNEEKLNTSLKIQNINFNKTETNFNSFLKAKNIIENKFKPVREFFGDMFQKFQNEVLNNNNNTEINEIENKKENEKEKEKEKENEKENKNNKETNTIKSTIHKDNSDLNCKFEDVQNAIYNSRFITERNMEYYNRNFIAKKPIHYTNCDYNILQLNQKQQKYDEIHKKAFEQFKRKINLKDENKPKNIVKKFDNSYEIEMENNPFAKMEITNKNAFLRDCRIRDIILTNKLKCEFSVSDIRRVLHGQKAWGDCIKCDRRFNNKHLPNSVEEYEMSIKNSKKSNEGEEQIKNDSNN